MKKKLLISTGGTFNKYYDPISGQLLMDTTSQALKTIARKTHANFEILSIIGKDSLDMVQSDRELLVQTIQQSDAQAVIVVHGTDTMDTSAEFVAKRNLEKIIVFTGAMVPYSINPVEATANLMLALGFIQAQNNYGVYIAMHGLIGTYDQLVKERTIGKFILKDTQ